MSTDFLVDTEKPSQPRIAIQVKTSSDLFDSRTIEKLELERRYWENKEVPWYLLTERQIPETVTKNIAWLYPAKIVLEESEETLDVVPLYLDFCRQNPRLTVSQAAMRIDQAYSLTLGESLQKIRSLMAHRVILFNIRKPWSVLSVGDLKIPSGIHSVRDRYAANQ